MARRPTPRRRDVRRLAADSDPDAVAAAWVARLASGEASGDDVRALRAWLRQSPRHAESFDRARAVWTTLGGAGRFLRESSHGQVEARFWAGSGWSPATAGALAASLVLSALVGGAFDRPDFSTHTGQVSRVTLPDGTQAVLDTETAIKVRYTARERRVELLRGRAWFDVRHAPARPFEVAAGGGEIHDVGTAFVVRRNGETVTTDVERGVVDILAHGQLRRLVAGQEGGWSARALTAGTAPFDPGRALGWRQDRLVFDHQSLADVLKEIARYRGGLIVLADQKLARRPVSGVFYISQIDKALDGLAANQKLTVVRLPYLVVLRA